MVATAYKKAGLTTGLLFIIIFPFYDLKSQTASSDSASLVMDQMVTYVNWAWNCNKNKDYQNAIFLAENAYKIANKNIELNNQIKFIQFISLVILAGAYENSRNYQKAIECWEELINFENNYAEGQNGTSAIDLYNMGRLYRKTGNTVKADSILLLSLKIQKKYDTIDDRYALTLRELARVYESTGNYEKAEELYRETIQLQLEMIGPDNPEYGVSLHELGMLCIKIGENEEAAILLNQASPIIESYDDNPHAYAGSLNNYGLLCMEQNDYEKAERLFIRALEVIRSSFGEDDIEMAAILNNLSNLYIGLGLQEKAESMLIQALDIIRQSIGEKNLEYAMVLIDLSHVYSMNGEFYKAKDVLLEVMALQEELNAENTIDYARTLQDLAFAYCYIGYFRAAEIVCLQSIKIQKQILKNRYSDYNNTTIALALIYQGKQEYGKAIKYIEKYFEDEKETQLHQFKGDYAIFYILSQMYVKQNEIEKVEESLTRNILRILDDFYYVNKFLSGSELEAFLEEIDANLAFCYSYLASGKIKSPKLTGLIYNAELSRKIAVLQSAIHLRNALLESSDTNLLKTFEKWKTLGKQIIAATNQPNEEDVIGAEEREEQFNMLENLEKEAKLDSWAFNDLLASLQITWEGVRSQLREEDAAIEFISLDYYNGDNWTDSTLYCALVLRKKFVYPKMVYLFEQKHLDSLITQNLSQEDDSYITQLYTRGTYLFQSSLPAFGEALYDLVWEPIDTLLSGSGTIYFAPSGSLNQVAFAALPYKDDQLLLDRYRLVQLSSTRELALGNEDEIRYSPEFSTVIYGDITYCSDTTRMKQEALVYNRSSLASRYRFKEPEGPLPPFDPLPSTSQEILGIEAILKENCYVIDGTKANEESFHSLSRNISPEIIHIATHGFFFTNPPEEAKPPMDLILVGQQRFILSDDPLQRSGLVFAGANHYWKGETLPQGLEDGLVTAKEISSMVLTNTQLVVLSACQTGLGDIRGGEGVFGLQRGFKMAGVKTLIMSLWKVPDVETALFMKTFYGEWLTGKPLRQAFIDTQRTMSKNYPNDPYKWAAFVMVQ